MGSEKELNEFRDAFMLFDTKFEGVIPAAEVGNLARAMGLNPKIVDVKKLTGSDTEPNKKVTFEEFVPIFLDLQKCKDDYKCMCDNENSGLAEAAVFKNILIKLGEKLEPDYVEQMMKGFEPNADGKIKYLDVIKKVMEDSKSNS